MRGPSTGTAAGSSRAPPSIRSARYRRVERTKTARRRWSSASNAVMPSACSRARSRRARSASVSSGSSRNEASSRGSTRHRSVELVRSNDHRHETGSSPARVRRDTTRSPSGETRKPLGIPSEKRRVRASCRGNSSSAARSTTYISLRPSSAWESVTSSAYSRSPPTGRPLASLVTLTPTGLRSAATYIAVAFPSRLGLVAMMTSLTPSRSTRSSSSCTRRSSGPIPSSGEIAPPSTWYRPRTTPARSIVAASFGSSTTQSTVRSRLSSRQIRQRSPSATLPHSLQKKIRSLACRMASARRLASSAGAFTRWKARRCADFGPIPGSRESSSIRSWIGPSYTSGLALSARLRAELGGQAGERLLLRQRRVVLHGLGRAGHGLADRAGYPRRDPEQLLERRAQLVLALADLAHPELAVRREHQLERPPVEGRRGRELEERREHGLAVRAQVLDERRPRAADHRHVDGRGPRAEHRLRRLLRG